MGDWLSRWSVVAIAGGATGAALLLLTPDRAFGRIAPFLIAAGSLALLLEPRLTAWRRGRDDGHGSVVALAAPLFVISIYNGYFGGGSGIMVLTLMLVLVDQQLASANALKNMLIGASQVVCAAASRARRLGHLARRRAAEHRHARREHPRPARGAAPAGPLPPAADRAGRVHARRLAVVRSPLMSTGELLPNDTAAVRGAREVARRYSSPSLFNHSARSYLWAASLGRTEGLESDAELLYARR